MVATHSGPVVLGVDDSSSGREAVVYAAWEAERRGLPLRIVHGYLVPTPCLTPLAPLLNDDHLIALARERLAEIAQVVRARRPELPLTTAVVRAAGGTALVKESASASLVIVGSPRHGGFGGSLAGSVAAQVVADARCPVVVVRRLEGEPAGLPGHGPVLVGVDETTDSERALEFGFEEAAARGVPLVAVHVWSVPEMTGFSGSGSGAEWSTNPDRAQAQLQEAAERTLAEVIAGWQERYPQVTVRRWTVHSFGTARVLLDVVREIRADLLVVGSRRRGGFAGLVRGSVGQVLISHAEAPVAVIHHVS